MKSKLEVAFSVALCLLTVSGPLFAHHSEAVYDKEHMVTIKATVVKHELVNPHTVIRVNVKDANGNVTEWKLIGAAVSAEREAGITQDTLKPGDEITVSGFAFKDGRPGMTWMRVVKADGKVLPLTGFKNNMLAEFLQKHGKELPPEEFELYKKSLTWLGDVDPRNR